MLATEHPDKTAVVCVPREGAEINLTWRELDVTSNRVARLLAERGGTNPSLVVTGLPNSPQHFFVTYAAWKLGACVLPMRSDLPAWERDRLLELANPPVIVADWEGISGRRFRRAT